MMIVSTFRCSAEHQRLDTDRICAAQLREALAGVIIWSVIQTIVEQAGHLRVRAGHCYLVGMASKRQYCSGEFDDTFILLIIW